MSDELVDVIDKNNKVVGRDMKSNVHQKGLKHRVSAVLLQDDKSRLLITTASNQKVEAGGLYHSAAGHVAAGESYTKSAIREVFEEIGLSVTENDLIFIGTFWMIKDYKSRSEKERFEVFLVRYTPQIGKITLNEEHVNERWFKPKELKNIYQNSPERLSYPLKLTCKNLLKKIPNK